MKLNKGTDGTVRAVPAGIPLALAERMTTIINSQPESEWPEMFRCRFIHPGLISYEDIGMGVLYVPKESLDDMAPSFVGRPVIDMRHQTTTPDNFEDVADGVVCGKPEWGADGWQWVPFIAWDAETKKHCRSGDFYVSCCYDLKQVEGPGRLNAINYDGKLLKGEYSHLAIVKNPRYEGSVIQLMNSKQGGSMSIKAWLKRVFDSGGKPIENSIDPAGTMVDVDGQQVPLQELIDTYKAEQAEIAAKAAQGAGDQQATGAEGAQAGGADPKEELLGPDASVPVDGKDVKIADMINSFKATKAKNDKGQETPEQKAEREGKEKAAKEAGEKEAADLEQAKNSMSHAFWTPEMQEKHAAVYNALVDADKAAKAAAAVPHPAAVRLSNAAEHRGGTMEVSVTTPSDRIKIGSQRYGSAVGQK